MYLKEVNPKIIEDVKDAFEKIKAAPNFSFNNENLQCLYRGPNGTKCVIGHLIPDSSYIDEMEGSNVQSLIVRWCIAEKYDWMTYDDKKYLDLAQRYHDAIAERNYDSLKPADTIFSYENFEETRL